MADKNRSLFRRVTHRIFRISERYFNQRRAYDYSPVATSVLKHPSPVLGDVMSGSMFDPCVVELPEGGLAMFVSRRDKGSIERWDSKDGIAWNYKSTALSPAVDASAWDSTVNRAGVLLSSSGWLMWYTGQNGGSSAIGFATSVDGLTFNRVVATPVIAPELEHEGGSAMNPCVMAEGNGYRMWYAAGEDYEPDVICEARSNDGVNWEKLVKPVLTKGSEPYDAHKVGGCSVLRLSELSLAMFYIGYQNLDVARICLALSDDNGLTWRRSSTNPLVGPERNAWDSHSVYKPSALLGQDGAVRLWYNARRNRNEYVGFATIDDIGRLS